MTIEFYSYIILILLTLVSAFYVKPINNKSAIISFIVIFTWIIIVRNSGYDVDFNTYNNHLYKFNLQDISIFYYIKEWAFWILGGLSYKYITHSYIATYLIYDVICLLLIIFTCKNLKLPVFFIFLFYVSFMSLMGYENIYRQFIATCFILFAFSLQYKNENIIKIAIPLFFAIFIHNSSLIFLPVLLFKDKLLWILSSILLIAIIIATLYLKKYSSYHIGLNLSYLYAIVLLGFTIGIYFTSPFKSLPIFIALYSIILSILLHDDRFERLAIMMLEFLLPTLCLIAYNFNVYNPKILLNKINSKILNILLVIFFVSPVFLFNSALQFIQ